MNDDGDEIKVFAMGLKEKMEVNSASHGKRGKLWMMMSGSY